MTSPAEILRTNSDLTVALALPLGLLIALGLVGLVLRAAGASLRPVVLIAILTAPLCVVFLGAGLVRARLPSGDAIGGPGLAVTSSRFAEPERGFGSAVDPSTIRDARQVFPGMLDDAEAAELAIPGTGESILVAQFPTTAAAKAAAGQYWTLFQARNTSGSESAGWRGRRGAQGDHFEMRLAGRILRVWTASDPTSCAALRASLDSGEVGVDEAPFPALQPLARPFRSRFVRVTLASLLVGFQVVLFFRGATWAGSSPAVPGTIRVSPDELRRRIESLRTTGAPMRVTPGPGDGELIVEWDPSDIRWIDHARVHARRQSFRTRLSIDAPRGVVRATDEFATWEASAGPDGIRSAWKAGRGIVFFQEQREQVLGFRWTQDGRLQADPNHAIRFSLRELRSPVIATVTAAGWDWRPVVWMAPDWLRWLTG